MKNIMAVTTAGLAAAAMSVALVGCSSGDKTETKTSTSSSSSSSASSSTSATATTSAQAEGKNMTIRDYIKANDITESPVKRGEPGSPSIDLPFPEGWTDAGAATPEWAWGAIVYTAPADKADPPSIIAIVSKLTGNVDPEKVLKYAPGELENLTGFEPLSDASKTTLDGFEAVQLGGTYLKDGKKRLVAQKTVVIPAHDGLFVLQMNADAAEGQEMAVMDATSVIDKETKIVP